MTNQQGAPEALRPIQRFNNIFGLMNPEARGLYVRYEDHVAALVEAQQPTTHVQNPAEIEHVAGDVSKNGAEVNVSTQQQECGNTPQANSQPAHQRDTGYPPLPECDATTVGLGAVWNRHSMRAYVDADRAARDPADSVLEDAALPMQPICVASDGIVRFKKNRMVNDLYEFSQPRGFGLNEMARRDYTQEERMQFAQLIGYSVSGYGSLSYASPESVEKADAIADLLIAARKQGATP